MSSSVTVLPIGQRPQRTVARAVSLDGIGVHSGEPVTMTVRPAPEGLGIVFCRTDLNVEIAAHADNVCDAVRSTSLGSGEAVVRTVEHLLAAMKGLGVDNAYIDMSSAELPIGDGSALPFVELLDKAGIVEQQGTCTQFSISAPLFWEEGNITLVALPSDRYRVSYTLSYPDNPILRAQFQSLLIDAETFRHQIAPARTFALYEEVEALIDHGLIRGGTLDNAVVIQDDVCFSKEGLRFPDEMVRHKLLDLVGDFSLLGYDLVVHLVAIRSGHATNCAFTAHLHESLNLEMTNV